MSIYVCQRVDFLSWHVNDMLRIAKDGLYVTSHLNDWLRGIQITFFGNTESSCSSTVKEITKESALPTTISG